MGQLNTQQLKDYLKMAFELEGALFKNYKLVDEYRSYRREQRQSLPLPEGPRPLRQGLPPEPTPPEKKDLSNDLFDTLTLAFTVLGLICLPLIFVSLIVFFYNESLGSWIMLILLATCLISFLISFIFSKISDNYADAQYPKEYSKYQKKLDEYYKKCAKIKEENAWEEQRALSEYERKVQEIKLPFDTETNKRIEQLTSVRKQLDESLDKLYEPNIIYPKYRNFVALATIYEYLESGRCLELEGPNGAYNLYESELRANTIISSLANITSDLEQIKAGQYALYEHINRSNQEIARTVSNLRSDIRTTQEITAYCAEVTAAAATADSYIVGMIW